MQKFVLVQFNHFKNPIKSQLGVRERVWWAYQCGYRREHELVSFGWVLSEAWGDVLRKRKRRTLVIKRELARVKEKLRKSRLGEFLLIVWCCFYLILIESCCMRGWVYLKTRAEIGFLEFFQKPPSGHAQPARRNKWQNQFPGFLIWTAWRQKMIR